MAKKRQILERVRQESANLAITGLGYTYTRQAFSVISGGKYFFFRVENNFEA